MHVGVNPLATGSPRSESASATRAFRQYPSQARGRPFQSGSKRPALLTTEMETWEPHKGTGLLTRLMPALDVDIYNPEAAKAVEELVRKRFEGRGNVLVRIGNAPKFAIPFRTSTALQEDHGDAHHAGG